jgi:hypothetical protein
VYCSREGLPDSLRNPKSNPQRKRPSKRCDCRWRVVLYEVDGHWEFRKSLNPDAGKHNHELMNPDEIERSWPKEVTDLICELARQRMTTQEVRNRVRDQFPNIHWNERRFYNRLSEERQKIKLRDSAGRTYQLNQIWSKLCMASAGSDDLSQLVHQQLSSMLETVTEAIGIDHLSLPDALIAENNLLEYQPSSSNNNADSSSKNTNRRTSEESSEQPEPTRTPKPSAKNDTAPKGYLSVEIPKQTYYIKIHNQRQLQETQLVKNQKRQRQINDEPTFEPLRRLSQKGKPRQQSLIISNESNLSPDSLHHHPHHSLAPQLSQHYQQDGRPGSVPVSAVSHQPNHQQQQQAPLPPLQSHQHQQQQQQHQIHPIQHPPGPTFVYHYDSANVGLDTSLTNYVNPTFQNTYSMNTSPSTPGFTPSEMSFSFDTSHSPIVRNTDSSNNEPTIHPALQSNPMAHQSKPHHSSSPEHINTSTIPLHQQSQMSGDHNDPRMYAMGLKQEQDKHQPEQVQQSSHQHNEQHEQQIQHEASNQSRMSSMYNSSKDGVSAMQSRNVLSDNNHQSYNNQQQQQRQQQHGLFIHQTPSPPDPHGHLERPL